MPWFPDFVSAVELSRHQARVDALTEPVTQYWAALDEGSVADLETAWPGQLVIHDPRQGVLRGHRQVRRFILDNKAWREERHARSETVASTASGSRAVVEFLAHLDDSTGREVSWPLAVV